jgi:hypothetical protein
MKKKDQILLEEAYEQVASGSKIGNVGDYDAKQYQKWQTASTGKSAGVQGDVEVAQSGIISNLKPGNITGPRSAQGPIFGLEDNSTITATTYRYGAPKKYDSIDINKASDDEIKKFILRSFEEVLSTTKARGSAEAQKALKTFPADKVVAWMKSFKAPSKKAPTPHEQHLKLKADQEAKRKSQQSGFQKFMGKLGFGK